MTRTRRLRFIHGQLAWMLAALLGLALLDEFTYEQFFVLSLIGFLVVTELTTPFDFTPRWRRRLRFLILFGLALFAVIVVRRILALLPAGVI